MKGTGGDFKEMTTTLCLEPPPLKLEFNWALDELKNVKMGFQFLNSRRTQGCFQNIVSWICFGISKRISKRFSWASDSPLEFLWWFNRTLSEINVHVISWSAIFFRSQTGATGWEAKSMRNSIVEAMKISNKLQLPNSVPRQCFMFYDKSGRFAFVCGPFSLVPHGWKKLPISPQLKRERYGRVWILPHALLTQSDSKAIQRILRKERGRVINHVEMKMKLADNEDWNQRFLTYWKNEYKFVASVSPEAICRSGRGVQEKSKEKVWTWNFPLALRTLRRWGSICCTLPT